MLKSPLNTELIEEYVHEENEYIYDFYSFFSIVGFILFFVLNKSMISDLKHEDLVLRLVSMALVAILMLRKCWPIFLKKYLNFYWHCVLIFNLPFFFTYMLVKNDFSLVWQLNELIAITIFTILLDLKLILILSPIGILFALMLVGQDFELKENIYGLVSSCITVLIFFTILSFRKRKFLEKRLEYEAGIIDNNHILEQKVKERTKELEAALAAKTEFLNNVSHEIRTPVQGFVNMSQAAYEDWGSFSDKEKHELLEKVFISASRLGSMVCSLLDLAKFTQGKMIMFPSDCELKKIIKEIIEECKFLYLTDKKIDIIFDFDGSIPLHVDKERITQLLRNLLFNAIKFSDSNTKIEIKLLPSELTYEDGSVKKSVHCIVTDEGKGVPENELEAIFEPFTQSTRTNTKAGGTGLGLAIAREIATSHHGKIWAENNETAGSSFHFIIPLALNKEEGEKTTTSYQDGKPETNGYVLLVDDESYVLNMLEIMLAFGNYKTLKAQNAKEGLAILKEYQNQIILVMLDYMMPGMDGLGFLKRKNADEELKKIPVIFQSGTNEEKVLNSAWEMGIASFLPKPYNRAKVLEEVDKVLKG